MCFIASCVYVPIVRPIVSICGLRRGSRGWSGDRAVDKKFRCGRWLDCEETVAGWRARNGATLECTANSRTSADPRRGRPGARRRGRAAHPRPGCAAPRLEGLTVVAVGDGDEGAALRAAGAVRPRRPRPDAAGTRRRHRLPRDPARADQQRRADPDADGAPRGVRQGARPRERRRRLPDQAVRRARAGRARARAAAPPARVAAGPRRRRRRRGRSR